MYLCSPFLYEISVKFSNVNEFFIMRPDLDENNSKETEAEVYFPNDDVMEISMLKSPNSGVHHEESEYFRHGLKILDSFVEKTNEAIKNMRQI